MVSVGLVGLVGMTPGGGGRFRAVPGRHRSADGQTGSGGPVAGAWMRGRDRVRSLVARSGEVRAR